MLLSKIDVVIPNWNGRKHLDECIPALLKQTFTDFVISVVDNFSSDDSIDFLKSFPQIRIIRLDRNWGFAKACNIGIEKSEAEYIALLNNDAIPEPDWLEKLIIEIDGKPEIAGCSSKMIKYFDRKIIDNCGHRFSLIGNVDIGLGRNIEEYSKNCEVFGICGGAALIRRKLFLDAGGFDEGFNSYIEDFDLNYRLRLMGFKFIFVHNAVVYHKGAQTFSIYSKKHSYYCVRNMWFALIKNYSLKLLKKYFFEIIKNDLRNLKYFSDRNMGFNAMIARLSVLIKLPQMLKKRLEFKKNIIINDSAFFELQ